MTFIDASFIPFLAAMLALTLAPGADTVLVIRNTMKGGSRDGLATSLGICTGLFVHALLSACGISLLLVKSAMLFHLVKLLGAGYLVWLGGKSLLSAWKNTTEGFIPTEAAREPDMKRSLKEGILSNVLNPKTAVFYMAFLPQFIGADDPVLAKSLFLAACHFLMAMVWLTLLSRFLDAMRETILKPAASRIIEGTSGLLLVLFGIGLGLARRMEGS